MRYVLAIGLETKIFNDPKLEVFLNDRFLGMTDLDESGPAEIQQHKKGEMYDAWDTNGSYNNLQKIYEITVPKKWIMYELDDSTFKKNNKLDIIPTNLRTNNMNGFVTKMDHCKIFNVMLIPKDWFSADGVQKIFSHCDGRNVIIDFDYGVGWPGINLRKNLPFVNLSVSVQIVYDEILELYIIENDCHDSNPGEVMLPVHTTVKNYYDNGQQHGHYHADVKTMISPPQKPFELNAQTTVLQVKNDTKVIMNQIATKDNKISNLIILS